MKAWLYILTTGIVVGGGGIATKYMLERGLDPVFGTAVMMLITAIGSVPLYLRAGGLDARGWRMAIVAGVLYAGGPAMLFNLGFERLPASLTTLVISLGPVFTAVAAHYLIRDDRFTATKGLGLLSSVAGVGLLAGSLTAAPAGGLAFPLAGAALAGTALLLVKRVATLYPPAATLTPMMCGSALISLALTAITGRWHIATTEMWLIMSVLGLAGVASFGAVLAAAEIAPASQTSLSGYLIPLLGVLGGVVFFDEPFGWLLAIGGALVLAGILLVGFRGPTPDLLPVHLDLATTASMTDDSTPPS